MRIKSKINPLKILLLLFLVLTMMFIPNAFASGVDYNGQGSGVDGGSGVGGTDITIGWNKYVGYRIYAISGDGEQIGQKIDFWFGSGTASKVNSLTNSAKGIYKNSIYPKVTRAGLGSSSVSGVPAETLLNASGNNEIPRPWNGFTSGGAALRGWIYTVEEGQEYCNGLRLIKGLWGEEAFQKYYNSDVEMYVILEGLSCHEIMDTENKIIGIFAGSAYNWAGQCTRTNQPYGNVWLRRGTNGIFGTGIELDDTWDGSNFWDNMVVSDRTSVGGNVNVESNWLSATELVRKGYDVHQYTFSSVMDFSTHTWDYGLGATPGAAPKVEDEKRDKVNIIKYYHTVNKETGEIIERKGPYMRTLNPRNISIEDEEEYTVEGWRISRVMITSPPSTWEASGAFPTTRNGTSSGFVSLKITKPDLERTLFVLLVKYIEEDEEEIVLELQESEISKYYELSQVTAWKNNRRVLWFLPSLQTVSSCPHVTHKHSDGSKDRCHSTTGHLNDTSLDFRVRNTREKQYKNILALKDESFEPEIVPSRVPATRVSTSSYTASTEHNYKFVIWRGDDKLTLSDYSIANKESKLWKNDAINALVNRKANKPESKRWTDRETDVPISINITKANEGDYDTSAQTDHGHNEKTVTAKVVGHIERNGNVKVYTYSGKSTDGSVASATTTALSGMTGVTKGNGIGVQSDDVISFYPYIRMTYQKRGDAEDKKTSANVLSQHRRSLLVTDYAEAGYTSSYPNINLTSQQWSVHQMATNPSSGNTWAGKNKVLPGGAIYSLSTQGGGSVVTVRTWQFVTFGDNQARLKEGGSTGLENHTVAKAQQAHKDYVASCVKSLNGYYITQGVNKDPNTSNVFSGNYIIADRDGSGLNGGLSSESKYYLNATLESIGNIQSAMLQASSGGTTEKYYRVYSDTSGNVYFGEGINATGSKILSKGDTDTTKLTGKAKELNDRTKLISNFITAIERNSGDDTTASWAEEDGKWYNESFELYCLWQETKISVGLTSPAKRETVLDPALCPTNKGKSDYFSSAYSSAYRNSGGSLTADSLGVFKEAKINIVGIENMLQSKTFIIPNVNVQDLKD